MSLDSKSDKELLGMNSNIQFIVKMALLMFHSHCDSLLTQKASNSAFQLYTTCREILVSVVPDSLPLENAAVLPLSVSTAASGLYCQLKLPLPSLAPKATGQSILIWGGSSSCGSSTIQLAVASGLKVVTTAGKANHDYVRSLGASEVFDHADADVIEKISKVLKAGDVAIACIAGLEAQKACSEIIERIGGGKITMLLPPQMEFPDSVQGTWGTSFYTIDILLFTNIDIYSKCSGARHD